MQKLTHIDEQGNAKMVDVSEKKPTLRTAVACSQIKMKESVWELVQKGEIDKGNVLSVSQVAGIMAAKKTSELIPMCHPLFLSGINIEFEFPSPGMITFQASVKTTAATGVEMEALTAASVTALTIYDMCKALDKSMEIGPTYLLEKMGGKSGEYRRDENG